MTRLATPLLAVALAACSPPTSSDVARIALLDATGSGDGSGDGSGSGSGSDLPDAMIDDAAGSGSDAAPADAASDAPCGGDASDATPCPADAPIDTIDAPTDAGVDVADAPGDGHIPPGDAPIGFPDAPPDAPPPDPSCITLVPGDNGVLVQLDANQADLQDPDLPLPVAGPTEADPSPATIGIRDGRYCFDAGALSPGATARFRIHAGSNYHDLTDLDASLGSGATLAFRQLNPFGLSDVQDEIVLDDAALSGGSITGSIWGSTGPGESLTEIEVQVGSFAMARQSRLAQPVQRRFSFDATVQLGSAQTPENLGPAFTAHAVIGNVPGDFTFTTNAMAPAGPVPAAARDTMRAVLKVRPRVRYDANWFVGGVAGASALRPGAAGIIETESACTGFLTAVVNTNDRKMLTNAHCISQPEGGFPVVPIDRNGAWYNAHVPLPNMRWLFSHIDQANRPAGAGLRLTPQRRPVAETSFQFDYIVQPDPGSPRISSTITTARLLGGQQFQIVGFGGPLNGTRPQKWIWDWAVIRLPRANRFNYPGVLNRRRQAAAGDGMYIVQHPAGRQRTIVWDTDVTPTGALVTAATPGSQACFAHPTRRCVQCTVASLDGATGGPGSMMRFLHYTCDTEGGSSGSPVMKLDAATTFTWELVGLHHGYDGTFNEAININLPSLVTAAF